MKTCSFFLSLFLFFGCRQSTVTTFTIEYEKHFDSIPSASGLALKDSIAYVVCDDGTGIYTVNLRNYRQNKIPISGLPVNVYREDRSVKHDFESACFAKWRGNEYLVAIGSGSGSGRDSMLMINMANYADQKIYPLEKFYKQALLVSYTDSTQLNIEGLTIAGDTIMFLNRGNNFLITCSANAFFSFIINKIDSLPQIKHRKVQLPSIAQHEARFSGIATLDEKHVLFSASVEDTPDWTKDGPVLGSLFGIYSLDKGRVITTYLLQDQKNKAIKEKIESVDLLQKEKDELYFLAIADNDDGTSKLFRIRWRGFEPK